VIKTTGGSNEAIVMGEMADTAQELQRVPPEAILSCKPHPEGQGNDRLRPLHNHIKPAIMSYRRRSVSSIIKHLLDSGFHRNDDSGAFSTFDEGIKFAYNSEEIVIRPIIPYK
jgi:hypothetical protein